MHCLPTEPAQTLSAGRGGAVTKPHDYSLLQSWRREGEACYIIASRSVQLDEVPERVEYERLVWKCVVREYLRKRDLDRELLARAFLVWECERLE